MPPQLLRLCRGISAIRNPIIMHNLFMYRWYQVPGIWIGGVSDKTIRYFVCVHTGTRICVQANLNRDTNYFLLYFQKKMNLYRDTFHKYISVTAKQLAIFFMSLQHVHQTQQKYLQCVLQLFNVSDNYQYCNNNDKSTRRT